MRSSLYKLGPKNIIARLTVAIVCLSAIFSPRGVRALPTFPAVVKATYALKPQGVVAVAAENCTLCHVSTTPVRFNPYGKDLRSALKQAKTQTLTADILRSIEAIDSDGDGDTNLAEFAADTLPGDPWSNLTGSAPGNLEVKSERPRKASAFSSTSVEEPGPFALQTLLFPRHAQHPVLVHFPIALLLVSLLFDALGYWKRNPNFSLAGCLNLSIAAISAPIAVTTGILAWIYKFERAPLTGYLLDHLLLGFITMLLIEGMWWVRWSHRGKFTGRVAKRYLLLGTIAFLCIALTGHLGGILAQN